MKKEALIFIAGLSACAVPIEGERLTDTEHEAITKILMHEEALSETITSLIEASDPLFTKEASPASSPKATIESYYDISDILRKKFEDGKIGTYSTEHLNDHLGILKERDYRGDKGSWIMLNRDAVDDWNADLLIHEASHMFQPHSENMLRYIWEEGLNLNTAETSEMIIQEGDMALLMTTYFKIAEKPIKKMLRISRDEEKSDEEREAALVTALEGTPEEFAELVTDKIWRDHKDALEVYGITRDELYYAFANIDLLSEARLEATREWNEVWREANEPTQELKAELQYEKHEKIRR